MSKAPNGNNSNTQSVRTVGAGRLAALLLTVVALCACSSIETKVDAKPGFASRDYRLYAWATPPLPAGGDPNLRKIDGAVREAVDADLQRRGFQQVERSAAVALVDYRLATQMDTSQPGINSPRDEAAKMWDLNSASPTDTAVYNHPTLPYVERSQLLLSIKSVARDEIVWQGSASKIIDNANPGQRVSTDDVRKAVAKLFEQLDPKR